MNIVQVGQLLTIASGFDRFITVDRITTEAWFLVLKDVDFEEAKDATVAHFIGPRAKETFAVRHILEAVTDKARLSPAAIEVDVRSAKARLLIDKSWPSNKVLPENIREALFTLRDTEKRAAAQRFAFDELEGDPIDPGDIGKDVP